MSNYPENDITMTGIEIIARERERQVEVEGFTPDHDLEHDREEIAWAAVHYAAPDPEAYVQGACRKYDPAKEQYEQVFPKSWEASWDKKGRDGRIRDLVRAGALVAAEIDRLQAEERAAPFPAKTIAHAARGIREIEDDNIVQELTELYDESHPWSFLSVDATLELLNDLLKVDPEALSQLVEFRVPCNEKLGEHPTVQVTGYEEDKILRVGFLGVLNGLFGVDKDGWGPIAAVFHDDDLTTVVSFVRSDAQMVRREVPTPLG